jgi:hypothetical protein
MCTVALMLWFDHAHENGDETPIVTGQIPLRGSVSAGRALPAITSSSNGDDKQITQRSKGVSAWSFDAAPTLVKPMEQRTHSRHKPFHPAGIFATSSWQLTKETKKAQSAQSISANGNLETQTQTTSTTILQEVYYSSGAGLYDLRLAAWRAFESWTGAGLNSTNYAVEYVRQCAAAGQDAWQSVVASATRTMWEASVRLAVQPSMLSDLAIYMNDVAEYMHLYQALERAEAFINVARQTFANVRKRLDAFMRNLARKLDALPFMASLRNVWKRHVRPVYIRVGDLVDGMVNRVGGWKRVRAATWLAAGLFVVDAIVFV